MHKSGSRLASAPVRLGAYAVILTVALGGGALVGATIGPDAAADGGGTVADPDMEAGTGAGSELPAGLAVSRDGYTLDLRTSTGEAGAPDELALVITGPDGRPLSDYEVEHDKELHLIVVSRDLAEYAHVHPTRDDTGLWTVDIPAMAPGSYRVFADFTPAGADGLTLGADLTVPGDSAPVPLPAASSAVTVDGYRVSFDGALVAGTESEVTVTVTRDGEPVTDLDPYLGALGHLVAIRDGDLAYLHVHPLETATGPGGPAVRFAVEVPTAGTYGLYFDFSHDGTVRTAPVIAEAIQPDAEPATDDGGPSTDAHDEHGG